MAESDDSEKAAEENPPRTIVRHIVSFLDGLARPSICQG